MANESILSDILKNLSVAGTGLATGAAGTPGALASLMASGGKWLGGKIAPDDQFVQGTLDYLKSGAEYATPEALQGYAEKLTGDYVKPETGFQKGVSEVSQDLGSLFYGGGLGAIKKGVKLVTFGNAAKQAVKAVGASEDTANTAKLMGMIASPLFSFSKVKPLYTQLYDDARSALKKPGTKGVVQTKAIRLAANNVLKKAAKGTGEGVQETVARRMARGALKKVQAQVSKVEVDKLSNKMVKETLKKSTKEITKDGLKNLKSKMRGKAFKILEKQHPPYIKVDEVWSMSKQLNQEISKMGKYAGSKQFILSPLRNSVNDVLELYGAKNRQFGHAFKNAQTLFGIEKGLPILDKAINKTVGLKDTGVSEYFRKSMAWGFGGLKGLFAKRFLGSMSKRGEAFLRSPAYRKASMDLAKAATAGNYGMVVNALRKLKKIRDYRTDSLVNSKGDQFVPVYLNPKATPKKSSGDFVPVPKEEMLKMMRA